MVVRLCILDHNSEPFVMLSLDLIHQKDGKLFVETNYLMSTFLLFDCLKGSKKSPAVVLISGHNLLKPPWSILLNRSILVDWCSIEKWSSRLSI